MRLSAELKRVDLSQLLPPQKIAFFINVYNALVIHAFVIQGPPTNMLARLRVTKIIHKHTVLYMHCDHCSLKEIVLEIK